MLFNSFQFILLFLPLALLAFHGTARFSQHVAFMVLTAFSLLFYAVDSMAHAALLAASITVNYLCGEAISAARQRPAGHPSARLLLWAGLSANLLLLGYFKYANFLIDNVNLFFGAGISAAAIQLPPGISFYTFVQIAYLVDAYNRKAQRGSFTGYSLFVSFFPHLIAGPIIHINDMMPQFRNYRADGRLYTHLATGLSIFIVGLAKKVLVADLLAEQANLAYSLAGSGNALSTLDAWIGTLSYTLQIYYDFSGYSDMAIGLAYMFGIRFPINFESPYKATSIIDFWRRWHMTLSRFLRDYVYIPLGGNRGGEASRLRNLMLTMLIGGLWHGAGWNFVLWGGIHGSLLVCAHLSRGLLARRGITPPRWLPLLTLPLTLFCVHLAWIPFRAETLQTAYGVAASLFTGGGYTEAFTAVTLRKTLLVLLATLALPNTQQIFPCIRGDAEASAPGAVARLYRWRPSIPCALATGALFTACVFSLTAPSTFIYFRF